MIDTLRLNASIWDGLVARRERLPHALLLTGQRGIGKLELARAFVAGLLCEQPRTDGIACGSCLACGWHAQGNHPDFRFLQPEAMNETEAEGEEGKKKASRQITIDQVRGLDEFLNVGTHRAGLRIVLVAPAEAMNRSTANSLLKSLEEPPPSTLFLLVSNEPMRLLPTIRSRCQVVPVPLPDKADALAALAADGVADAADWLALAGGAPILAGQMATSRQGNWTAEFVRHLSAGMRFDALAAASAIDKLVRDSKGGVSLRQIVEGAQKWAVDLLLARNQLPVRYYVRQTATIGAIAQNVPETRLLRFHRRLLECRREVEQPLNARLFLEEFFLNYRALFLN